MMRSGRRSQSDETERSPKAPPAECLRAEERGCEPLVVENPANGIVEAIPSHVEVKKNLARKILPQT